jgi:hypothetical protein
MPWTSCSNYDPVAAGDQSLVADAEAAVAMLERTFTNNITLTFDVGLGTILRWDNATLSFFRGPQVANGAAANINFFKSINLTYSELRTNLVQFGQPNLFTPHQSARRQQHQQHVEFLHQLQRREGFRAARPDPPG